MRIKNLLCSTLAVFGIALFVSTSAFAQLDLTIPYLSNENVARATQAAEDSLGGEVLLVGIATAGEIDLETFGKYKGFDPETGKSNAWGYQFLTPTGDEGVAVAVIQLIIGEPYVDGERGNDFGLQPQALDLTGAYANSDAFATRIRTNSTYNDYMQDYPDAIAEAVVLTWEPDGEDFLPEEFPVDKPIWAIYFNTNSATPNDSTMACFVASGTGETHCVRADISSVENETESSESVRLSVAPNPVTGSGDATLHIDIVKSEGDVREVGVYDVVGRKVLDLTESVVAEGVDGLKAELSMEGLSAGTYICRVVQGDRVSSVQFVVE